MLIYLIALVVCFVGLCVMDKQHYTEITIGDLLINAGMSLIPIVNILFAIIAWGIVLIHWAIHQSRFGGWMDKKVW